MSQNSFVDPTLTGTRLSHSLDYFCNLFVSHGEIWGFVNSVQSVNVCVGKGGESLKVII